MLRRPSTMMLLCNAWLAGCGAPAARDPGDTADPTAAATDDTDTTDLPAEIFVPESTTDSDADGLSDLVEARLGTSPTDADSDDDGLSDGEEVSWGHNPTRDDAEAHGDDVGMYVDSPATQRVTMTICAGSEGDQRFKVALGASAAPEPPEGASVAVWRGDAVFVAEITRWVPSANGQLGELRVVVPPEDPRAAWFCGDPDKLHVATSVRRASGADCVMGGPDALNGALRDDVPDWITPACVPPIP
jgi:hypothetical protein